MNKKMLKNIKTMLKNIKNIWVIVFSFLIFLTQKSDAQFYPRIGQNFFGIQIGPNLSMIKGFKSVFDIDFYAGLYRGHVIDDYVASQIDLILSIHSFQGFYKMRRKIGKKFMVKVKKK
ncbi:MAG TPA: hypothetical protein VE128_00695 [Candidatus Angelobacter sp.]|jgi:hypothetical protein|nr:hypothetical protein [Candidatus Angelobacter sp.]